MFKELFIRLDRSKWPQKIVRWALQRRARTRLSEYLFPVSSATHAVTLIVASPLLSFKDLFDGVVPKTFGGWTEYKVLKTSVCGSIAIAHLEALNQALSFALILPVHADFPHALFRRAKHLRLTCEAQRAGLISVRERNGALLAAGILEFTPHASYSEELRT